MNREELRTNTNNALKAALDFVSAGAISDNRREGLNDLHAACDVLRVARAALDKGDSLKRATARAVHHNAARRAYNELEGRWIKASGQLDFDTFQSLRRAVWSEQADSMLYS